MHHSGLNAALVSSYAWIYAITLPSLRLLPIVHPLLIWIQVSIATGKVLFSRENKYFYAFYFQLITL
jgi:hypothetical protein